MTDFPSGEWSLILIGDYWPDDLDLVALSNGKSNRATTSASFNDFATLLHDAQTGSLAEQLGITASDLRTAFQRGIEQAQEIADANRVKESAYAAAYDSVSSLRQELRSLAEEGNREIRAIQNSEHPAETKVIEILAVIHKYRSLANFASAKYGANVLDALQRVLDQQAPGQSAYDFVRSHGTDLGQIYRCPIDDESLRDRVRGVISTPGSGMGFSRSAEGSPQLTGPRCDAAPGRGSAMGVTGAAASPDPTGPPARAAALHGSRMNITDAAISPRLTAPVENLTASPPPASTLTLPSSAVTPPHLIELTTAPDTPLTTAVGGQSISNEPPLATTPIDLVSGFKQGLESGTEFSPATHATSQALSASTESHMPSTPPAAPTTQMHAQAFDAPQPIQHTPAPDLPTQMVAAPIAPANPVAPPVTPATPLPTYGSDIRPLVTTATTTSAPPSPAPPAAPTSAPVHPSSAQSGASQPSVVRHGPPTTKLTPPPNVATEAAVATATGAATGAASAKTAARQRLERLVAAVARQQPRLAWAAGDRPDNTTLLTTDLASGWIPPGIALPAAVTLLQPAQRRGDLDAMLGEVRNVAKYTQIHHVPDDHEPPATSTRPRQTPEIAELGWQLSNATQWRDGLPRLAHTLAKAASAGTGVLKSEIELLHEHITTVSTKVLDAYPDRVDAHDVGNWQLLAAIDALIAGDKAAANYHLAWFLVRSNEFG